MIGDISKCELYQHNLGQNIISCGLVGFNLDIFMLVIIDSEPIVPNYFVLFVESASG